MTPYEMCVVDREIQEQLIRSLDAVLPEEGLGWILADKKQVWSNREQAYTQLINDTQVLQDMIARIDDGDDPVWTQVEDHVLVGTHLLTPCCDYGYAMLVIEKKNTVFRPEEWPMIECILKQMQYITGLLEIQPSRMTA